MKIKSLLITSALFLSACGGGSSSEAVGPETEQTPQDDATDVVDTEIETSAPVIARIHTGKNAELMNELETTRVQVINSIQNLNNLQWVHAETDDRWSIAEITEHMVSAERLFLMLIDTYVIDGDGNEAAAQRENQTDDEVVDFIRNRMNQMSAPSQLQPAGVYQSAAQGVAAFEKERELTISFVRNTDVNLRAFAQAFPGTTFKPMDAHQWILYISGHTSRHLSQIAQVKADNEYPF